jgi:curved DNA-binding protein CbpA
MAAKRSYYEILGLPRDATAEQIKKRYRQLARKYHPDVVEDKAFGQEAFVEISEAYKTLIDPSKRAAYNLTLPPPPEQKRASTGTRTTQSYTSSSTHRSTSRQHTRPTTTVDSLIKDAQFSFVKGRLNEATLLCRQAINLDNRNAKAHAILGDIYTAKHKIDQAVIEYEYAVRYDPLDNDSLDKLEKLSSPRKSQKQREQRERAEPRKISSSTTRNAAAINAIGWPLAFAIMMFLSILPEEPIASLRNYLPLVDKWSWNVIAALFLSSAMAGVVMMSSGLLRHPDEELVFDESGILPIGIPLLLFSVVFFWGAAALYLILGALQGSLSKSVLKIFAAVTAVVLIAGFLYPMGSNQVWLFGGNVAFTGALAGWYGSAISRPLSG